MPTHIVDIPGSQKFSSEIVALMPDAKLIIFMIDANDFKVAESGSMLFKNIICNEHFLREKLPLLIVGNKVESNHKTVISNLKSLLESEITSLALAYEEEHGGEEAIRVQRIFNDSHSFSFDEHDVSFLAGSVLKSDFVEEIKEFIF